LSVKIDHAIHLSSVDSLSNPIWRLFKNAKNKIDQTKQNFTKLPILLQDPTSNLASDMRLVVVRLH